MVRLALLVTFYVFVITACGLAEWTPRNALHAGELRWSIEGVTDLPSLDPAQPLNAQAVTVINLVFGGLVRFDSNLQVKPDGAESWSVSNDGKVYTFKLRSNLQFADGTPVTANDFVYAINRALKPTTRSFTAFAQLDHILGAADVAAGHVDAAKGVQALDNRTLELTLDAPSASFLGQLTYPYTFVVPRKLVEMGASWTDHAYGTGPFQVEKWLHGQDILLKANTHYWQGVPGIAQVRLPFFEQSEDAYQEYRAGKLDIMGSIQDGVPVGRVAEVRNSPDLRTAQSLVVRFVGFNTQRPPFNNRFIRQAFALAVDKQALTNQVLHAAVIPTNRILPQALTDSPLPVRGQAFDPLNARTALGLAGFVSGRALPAITLTYAREGDNQLVVDALQNNWRDVLGVNIKKQSLPLKTFSTQLDATYYQPAGGLQLFLNVWVASYSDPQNVLSQLRTNKPNNQGRWSNPVFDRLTGRADNMGDQSQANQRLELYAQAEQIALDDVAWLPLYNPDLNILVRPSVQGLLFTSQGLIAPDWSQVSVGT